MLPLVGSKIVAPGFSAPDFSAALIINKAVRSLIDPVGLRSSSFAHKRTGGAPAWALGDNFGNPINGVCPSESSSESNLVNYIRPRQLAGLLLNHRL